MKFHNPYAFIPVTGQVNGEPVPKSDYQEIATGKKRFVRHDRWDRDALSGRIVCRLTTRSPLVVGGEQTPPVKGQGGKPSTPGVVTPYFSKGRLAIPGNSLRGMVGSVAEAISQSALRVLANETYEVRVRKGRRSRREPVQGDVYGAFESLAGPDVLPWSGKRNALTAAEAMFGVVEQDVSESDSARNLASRVRFHDALPDEPIDLEAPVTLKILASPKPPAPAMYFRGPSGEYIRKNELDLSCGRHLPNGRKRYIPHRRADIDKRCWETCHDTKDLAQKLRVRPIPDNKNFHFHIDFENLSKGEFGLLLTAIEPKRGVGGSGQFLHRLGLGKPLGLGHVEVAVLGVFLIERRQRYTDAGLDAPRYSRCWGETAENWSAAVKARYPLEKRAASGPLCRESELEIDQSLVDHPTLHALVKSGQPGAVVHPVCYPFLSPRQRPFNEREGFRWFNENDKGMSPQRLPNIEPASKVLPTLDSDVSGNLWRTGTVKKFNHIRKR